MKEFKDGDIFHNIIRAYPKVSFFLNSGVAHYNKQNYPAGSSRIPIESVGFNELINPIYIGPSTGIVVDGALMAENTDFLLTETGDYLAF